MQRIVSYAGVIEMGNEKSIRGWAVGGVAAALLLLAAVPARATLLVADFNDLAPGGINGKAGGTGFTGNWSGSAIGQVVANNLTSALYAITQTGTAQRYRNDNSQGLRQNYRTPAVSPTGTVWFSFLARAEQSGDRAGLSLNAPTGTPFNDTGTVYAYLTGSTLNYQFGTGTAGTVINAAPVGTTALVVGRMVIAGSGGADSIQLWINPDLMANPDINAYAPVYSSSSVHFLDSIATVGAVAARVDGGTSGGGNVDSIRISDGGGDPGQAYYDVTGVPEPSSVVLLAIGAMGGLAYRWRRRRSSG
jgi:hypothetical protein